MEAVWKANQQWYLPSANILSKGAKIVPFPVEKVKIGKGKELYQVGFCENAPFVFLTTEVLNYTISLLNYTISLSVRAAHF
jgi:hypothetical protein